MISPETLEIIQKGGMVVLLLVAIGWLVADRNRLLESLKAKDQLIAAKDEKIISISERAFTVMAEIRILMGGGR